ncbi:MAG: tRNA (adenine(22)-N(1))-methyltransferase TrmK, partial [Oscillospiraceae bacterium]|nr:tRNA (adenine(22)-N(1))-methyltransferase TrmK [Oscillospiraceae bacterium]
GLALCPPDAVDTVLIAGMGGDTICGILDRAEWLFSGTYRLVLQPMTHAEVLRFWLVHNAFQITREAVIAEGEHVYQMFCASPGKDRAYTDAEYLTGNRACVSLGDDRRLLLQHERARLRKKTTGMQKAGQEDSPAFRFYKNILLELEDLVNNADC